MSRSLLIVMSGVLLLAGSAQAFIGRTQSFDIGALNRIEWAGGVGSAQGENHAAFAQRQEFRDYSRGLSGLQKERGTLAQNASATGEVGPSSVEQNARIRGSQHLGTTWGRGLEARQRLGAALDNVLVKPNGIGSVAGRQQYTGAQVQSIMTPHGSSGQSQRVEVIQSSSIGTETDIDPAVTNKVSIQLNQSQTAGGR